MTQPRRNVPPRLPPQQLLPTPKRLRLRMRRLPQRFRESCSCSLRHDVRRRRRLVVRRLRLLSARGATCHPCLSSDVGTMNLGQVPIHHLAVKTVSASHLTARAVTMRATLATESLTDTRVMVSSA